MKTVINCLREFAGLPEGERPAYLLNHGDFITDNAGTFPDIVYDGATVVTAANKLFGYYSSRGKSDAAMTLYTKQEAYCLTIMESNYDTVDLVAQGNGDIVALAGVRGTSVSTARVGIPSTPAGAKFEFVDGAGEMILGRNSDKLAQGSIIVTFTDPKIIVVKSGDTQLKATAADGSVIFIDVVTVIKALIQNQVKGTEIKSVIANFNTNGISPVASPEPIIVPR